MAMELFNYSATCTFIEEAVARYSVTAPTVAAYLNDLYIRLADNPQSVSVLEISSISQLRESDRECDVWYAPNMAANFIYHLMERLGLDTTGHIGF